MRLAGRGLDCIHRDICCSIDIQPIAQGEGEEEQEEQEQEFICSSRRYCGSGEAGVLAIIWLRWSAMFWSFAIILVKSLVIRSDGRALRPIYASRSIQVTSKQVAVRNVTHDRGGGVCRTRGTDHYTDQ